MTETDHVVTTPVLIEQLTTTLVIYVLQSRSTIESRCVYVSTNLVEQALCSLTISSRSTTCNSLSLKQQNVGITEDRQVVRLVTTIDEVFTNDEILN